MFEEVAYTECGETKFHAVRWERIQAAAPEAIFYRVEACTAMIDARTTDRSVPLRGTTPTLLLLNRRAWNPDFWCRRQAAAVQGRICFPFGDALIGESVLLPPLLL